MKRAFLGILTTAAILSCTSSVAANPILSSGGASATIRTDNGAIDAFTFGGSDYFNPASQVSDYGFQVGTGTGTFGVANTLGGTSNISVGSVVSDGTTVTVTGTYNGAGGGAVPFTRTYAFVPGLDVLRVTTSVTNNTGADLTLRAFDTFDPDQGFDKGNGFNTFNDVIALGSADVAQASESDGLTSIIGSADPSSVVSAGFGVGGTAGSFFPFNIGDGNALNEFFANPRDDNGAFSDWGSHVGTEFLLGLGQTGSFSFDIAVGLTPADAQGQFQAAQVVPEPLTLASLGLGLAGLALVRRRRRQVA